MLTTIIKTKPLYTLYHAWRV